MTIEKEIKCLPGDKIKIILAPKDHCTIYILKEEQQPCTVQNKK